MTTPASFRVVPSFVVQFGISAYPPVAAAWEKANIQDEPVTQSNKRGYLTYAENEPAKYALDANLHQFE